MSSSDSRGPASSVPPGASTPGGGAPPLWRAVALVALTACAGAPLPALGASVRDSVPSATLLLPHFIVSRNGIQPGTPIPAMGTDTVFRVVNTGTTGVVVRVQVWNKYGSPVFGFNVPTVANDMFTVSMRSVLNGSLNVNPLTQSGSISSDPCGLNQTSNVYAPSTGFGSTKFVRFSNPSTTDAHAAICRYPAPAFTGLLKATILDSLDESGELTGFLYPPGANVIDADNPRSGTSGDGVLSGDFSGYVTLDVVNYCTELTPKDPEWAGNDAIATAGWSNAGYTPNVLIGSYKYSDAACGSGGDFQPMPGLEFDPSLSYWVMQKTFYGRFSSIASDTGANPSVPATFRFIGDGRKPLGTAFSAEFAPATDGVTLLTIWRSDLVANPGVPNDVDVAGWYAAGGTLGYGFTDAAHEILFSTFDSDANENSGDGRNPYYVFLQTQRYAFPPAALNPGGFTAGWMNLTLPGGFYAEANVETIRKVCSGDPNGDGVVNVSDVFYLINFLFAGGPAPK